ncbi:MAG: AAA family ATPase [Chloroflexi bacterium]|nr:AAA family ATPase [Chloroflexota bacterium]
MKLGKKWFDSSQQNFEHQTERLGVRRWTAPYRATLCYLVNPFRNDQLAAPQIAPLLHLKERIGDIWRYRVSANDIASFAKAKVKAAESFFVGENGWGLSLALQQLQGLNRKLFEAIEQDLNRFFPHIKFINFQSERFGVGLAFTTDRSEDLVPASQESDGVLLTLFLLWRLWTAPYDKRMAQANLQVCLEEPENGVHPYLLGERFRLLKEFAVGNRGQKAVQLLIATHSPDFLSSIDSSEEAYGMIRVVEFDREEGTKVHNLKDFAQFDTLLSTFKNNLGDLWWSGAIGAVPSSLEHKGKA